MFLTPNLTESSLFLMMGWGVLEKTNTKLGIVDIRCRSKWKTESPVIIKFVISMIYVILFSFFASALAKLIIRGHLCRIVDRTRGMQGIDRFTTYFFVHFESNTSNEYGSDLYSLGRK
jgi:hypothetical protein